MFGEWGGLAFQFAVTAGVIIALIGGIYWLVRRYSAGGIGRIGRGRVPRLAIIDAMSVDARRRLVLVRRDNVEHLLLVGGPSDVVVEQTIQRVRRPARPQPSAEAKAANDAKSAPETPRVEPVSSEPPPPENPPIPFPRPHVAEASQSDRSYMPLRRVGSAQAARMEPVSSPIAAPQSGDPDSANPGEAPAIVAQPTDGGDHEQAAPPTNVSPFAAPTAAAAAPGEGMTKVNDLEREMARLLGEITGRKSS